MMLNASPQLRDVWNEWRRMSRPFDNFRRQEVTAPTYKIECDLDHQADYIRVLVEAWFERNGNWDVPMRARSELADLQTFEAQLCELATSDSQSAALTKYMRVTKQLLDVLVRDSTATN